MKVAKVIDRYTVAITKDKIGNMAFVGDILGVKTELILDPETDEVLGYLPKYRVKVTAVYQNFILAETYRIAGRDEPFLINISKGDDVVLLPSG